jgi:hypothetical protein
VDEKAQTTTEESKAIISPDSLVSMNMWACYPDFLEVLEENFVEFLKDESREPLKKEFLIPVLIDKLIHQKKTEVRILPTEDKWIGITYREDTEAAIAAFAKMTEDGIYPKKLW